MERSTNALSELAEFLESESKPSSEEFKAKAIETFGVESWKRLEERKRKFYKCSRIIAKLAEMDGIKEYLYANHTVFANEEFVDVFRECRAIAEEGNLK